MSTQWTVKPIAIAMLLSGCQQEDQLSDRIQQALSGHDQVDLATTIPGDWVRVCILGPYSDNASASKVLGFEWNVESRSSIKSNEGITLLLFVRDNETVASTEYPRRFGDFSNLSGRCFSRTRARFVQVDKPNTGWPGLFPQDEPLP